MPTNGKYNTLMAEKFILGFQSGNISKQIPQVSSLALSSNCRSGGSEARTFAKSSHIPSIHRSITFDCSMSPVPLASAFPSSPTRVAPAAVSASCMVVGFLKYVL